MKEDNEFEKEFQINEQLKEEIKQLKEKIEYLVEKLFRIEEEFKTNEHLKEEIRYLKEELLRKEIYQLKEERESRTNSRYFKIVFWTIVTATFLSITSLGVTSIILSVGATNNNRPQQVENVIKLKLPDEDEEVQDKSTIQEGKLKKGEDTTSISSGLKDKKLEELKQIKH